MSRAMQSLLFPPETVATVETTAEIRRFAGVATKFPLVATVATVGIRAGAAGHLSRG